MLDPFVREIDETVSSVSTSLLDRARGNDQDSWNLLVEIHAPLVYGWCRNRGLAAEEASDVGQEVFVAVARSIDSFQRIDESSTFRGWLRRITENKIRDYWRKSSRSPSVIGDEEKLNSVEAPCDDSESTNEETKAMFVQILEHARGQISDLHWNVFWDLVVEGYCPASISEKYALERHNVYVIKSRILKMLRDIPLTGGKSD